MSVFWEKKGCLFRGKNQRFIKIRVLFWPEISALGVFFIFDNERMHPPKYPSAPPPPREENRRPYPYVVIIKAFLNLWITKFKFPHLVFTTVVDGIFEIAKYDKMNKSVREKIQKRKMQT